jgi:hypothetical protein
MTASSVPPWLAQMKVPISETQLIDLDAPVLPAYEAIIKRSTRRAVWCEHCQTRHRHGPAEGHREAHCGDPASPNRKGGYNLACAGRWKPEQK